MALDKDILGAALYAVRQSFSNLTIQQIIGTYGSLEAARLSQAKQEADVIITHFKTNSVFTIPSAGYVAPSGGGPVTGVSVTGTIT